ncbi:calcium-binding protein, partial [Brucella intermedia]|uniref:calcium-binding protein n=1 Tax=Brucella intermedia TaxID=94625 RepID=UPI0005BB8595
SILLKDSLNDHYGQGVETITFADGTSWTQADLRDKLNVMSETDTYPQTASQADRVVQTFESRRLYKTEDEHIAGLHKKGYGSDGRPLPGPSFPKKRDPLGLQARMRKEWNEWKDPYFAKHPHKQEQTAPVLSPERQRIRNIVAESVACHNKRLAEAAELAPKTAWQR